MMSWVQERIWNERILQNDVQWELIYLVYNMQSAGIILNIPGKPPYRTPSLICGVKEIYRWHKKLRGKVAGLWKRKKAMMISTATHLTSFTKCSTCPLAWQYKMHWRWNILPSWDHSNIGNVIVQCLVNYHVISLSTICWKVEMNAPMQFI